MRKWLIVLVLMLTNPSAYAEEIALPYKGLTLLANLETTGDDWRKGPVVLLLHGTIAHGRMEIMSGLQTALKDRGVTTLSPTLSLNLDRREGMYDCKVPHTHRHSDAVGEVDVWTRWLREQGVERLSVLGHSRGGNQIARYAAEHPEAALEAVFLIAPGQWDPEEIFANNVGGAGWPKPTQIKEAERLVAAGRGGEMIQSVFFLHCPDTVVTAESLDNYYVRAAEHMTFYLARRIKAPVTFFVGTQDTVQPGLVQAATAFAESNPAQVVVIDGADHFFRDLYLEDIADRIAATLGG